MQQNDGKQRLNITYRDTKQNPNGTEITKTFIISAGEEMILEQLLRQAFHISGEEGLMLNANSSTIWYPVHNIDIIEASRAAKCELQTFPINSKGSNPANLSVVHPKDLTSASEPDSHSQTSSHANADATLPLAAPTLPSSSTKTTARNVKETSAKQTTKAKAPRANSKAKSNSIVTPNNDNNNLTDKEKEDKRKFNRGLDQRRSYLKEEKIFVMLMKDAGKSAEDISHLTGVSKSNVEKWCSDKVREKVLIKFKNTTRNPILDESLRDNSLHFMTSEPIKFKLLLEFLSQKLQVAQIRSAKSQQQNQGDADDDEDQEHYSGNKRPARSKADHEDPADDEDEELPQSFPVPGHIFWKTDHPLNDPATNIYSPRKNITPYSLDGTLNYVLEQGGFFKRRRIGHPGGAVAAVGSQSHNNGDAIIGGYPMMSNAIYEPAVVEIGDEEISFINEFNSDGTQRIVHNSNTLLASRHPLQSDQTNHYSGVIANEMETEDEENSSSDDSSVNDEAAIMQTLIRQGVVPNISNMKSPSSLTNQNLSKLNSTQSLILTHPVTRNSTAPSLFSGPVGPGTASGEGLHPDSDLALLPMPSHRSDVTMQYRKLTTFPRRYTLEQCRNASLAKEQLQQSQDGESGKNSAPGPADCFSAYVDYQALRPVLRNTKYLTNVRDNINKRVFTAEEAEDNAILSLLGE